MAKQDLLLELREGRPLALRQQTALTLQLSFPAILAQISSIVMQYIDAAMVGQLGRDASAAIGLVASSTWLFGGLCRALMVGFSVMVAQRIGAGEEKDARNLVKQGLCAGFAFGLLIAAVGGAIARGLPHWLHADSSICPGASSYFLIFALSLPFVQLNRLAVGLLQAGGNMRTPSMLLVLMCGLDVVFNSLLIFPTRQLGAFTLPGADLGVTGAALGTALSETVVAIILCICLLRSPMLGLRKGERLRFVPVQLRRAVRLGAPVAIEQAVMSSAQVVTTRIIASRFHRRTLLFARPDAFGRFTSCLVVLPRDRYTPRVRERIEAILMRAYHGTAAEHSVRVSDSTMAILHFVIRRDSVDAPTVDLDVVQEWIRAAVRTWHGEWRDALIAEFGEVEAARLASRKVESEAAFAAAHKAYRYVTDDCYCGGVRYTYPTEFWVGPYVYWLFSAWHRDVGPEPVFDGWVTQIDRFWRETRGWKDFMREPGSPCERASHNGMLEVSILGYLGLRHMEELGLAWTLLPSRKQ